MFVIQPGQGLGFTGSKQIALGLGGFTAEIIEPPTEPAKGGGAGTTYDKRRKLIDEENEAIMAVIIKFLEVEG